MSNVIHPGHYNIPGRKECIEEMLDKFGYGKTEAFCELNSYKYQYRHEQKNGQEDLENIKNNGGRVYLYIQGAVVPPVLLTTESMVFFKEGDGQNE